MTTDDEPSTEKAAPAAPAADAIPMDKLAKVYRKISAVIQERTQEFEAAMAGLEQQRNEIKNALKDQMLVLGVSSVKTDAGTVVLSTKTRYTATDWDAFKTFVVENDALDLFEKRIAQGNMASFLEDNPGKTPPGLNSFSEYTVSVRKPTAK
jgi:hypothetical protein